MLRPLLVATAAFVSLSSAAHAAEPSLTMTPAEARPGDLVVLSLPLGEGGLCPEGSAGRQVVTFHALGGKCQALLALPVEHAPGKLPLRLAPPAEKKGQKQAPVAAELTVLPPAFNVRELKVAKKFVSPPKTVKRRMAEDRKAFAAAFAQKPLPAQFSANFDWPRRDVMTAPFGDLRTFNGKKQSQHFGMDIDGRVGDPIVAANDGVVVMVRDNYAAGQTVMIHHGLDVYTTYFHLSSMDVKPGQRVKRGEPLGKVGKTGRVTGAHLHFGAKVNGLYVDPATLMRADLFGGAVATATPDAPLPVADRKAETAAGGSGE